MRHGSWRQPDPRQALSLPLVPKELNAHWMPPLATICKGVRPLVPHDAPVSVHMALQGCAMAQGQGMCDAQVFVDAQGMPIANCAAMAVCVCVCVCDGCVEQY